MKRIPLKNKLKSIFRLVLSKFNFFLLKRQQHESCFIENKEFVKECSKQSSVMGIEDKNTQPSTKSSNSKSMNTFSKLDQRQKQSIQKSSNPKDVKIPSPQFSVPNQTSEFSLPFNSNLIMNPMGVSNNCPTSNLLFLICFFIYNLTIRYELALTDSMLSQLSNQKFR